MKLDNRVILTHTDPTNLIFSEMIEIKADYGDGQEMIANIYHKDIEGALSIAKHICAIPEMTKAIDAYIALGKMKHSLAEDFEVKSKEVERLMKEAHEKLNNGE